jgi:hypothetical protein
MGHSREFTLFLAVAVVWSIVVVVNEPLSPLRWVIIFAAIYVWTDLLSGLLHVVLDNERSLDISVIESLARGFQSHHRSPSDIYTMSLYNHLYTMHLPLTIVFGFVVLCGTSTHYAVFLCLALMLHLMQMSHRWAHLPRPQISGGLKALQRVGILLDPTAHRRHHRGKYDINFCIMNGWLNPALNFFIPRVGRTSHAWIGLFLLSAAMPLGFAFL